MGTKPWDPGERYTLDWENEKRCDVPLEVPPLWIRHYDPSVRHDGEPQVRAAHKRCQDEPGGRGGNWSVRFDLHKGDPIIREGKRCELVAGGYEPTRAERWYGFSVYLTRTWWKTDPAGDSVMQWYHVGGGGGSPPLSLVTRNGRWEISQHWEDHEEHTSVGEYQVGKWTDWVVHVKWSWESDGKLEIWKDKTKLGPFSPKLGKNTYKDTCIQLKFGVYKWPWNPCWKGTKSNQTRRVMYYDELRIADHRGSLNTVAPWLVVGEPRAEVTVET